MPSALPPGDPVPEDGRLPASAVAGVGSRPFGFYVHVPFCTVRCGYCDFNTYTADELGEGVTRATYAMSAIREIRMARTVLGDVDLPVSTVFFGGGTPTLLPPQDLIAIVAALSGEFGLAEDVEVTTESNPDSVTAWDLETLREGGINRVSFGMQSAVPQYLDAAMEAFQKNQQAMAGAFGQNMFADLAKRNMAMFEEAAHAMTGQKSPPTAPSDQPADEIAKLKAELAALQAKVDKLGK